jgi:hypothetical protein
MKKLLEWIWGSKEWLFSGIGLVTVGLIWRWILGLLRSRAQAAPPFDQAIFRTRPLPDELVASIDAAPPVHQAARAREILSIAIQWKTTLDHVHEFGGDTLSLMLLDRGRYPWVSCAVLKTKYPDLLLASKGTVIWVAGRIAKYESNVFEIGDPELRIIMPSS